MTDIRLEGAIRLLRSEAQLSEIGNVLDVGIGGAELAVWFSDQGKNVTGVGVSLESYGVDFSALNASH